VKRTVYGERDYAFGQMPSTSKRSPCASSIWDLSISTWLIPSMSRLVFYRMQGKYAQAEQFYQQALHIRENQLGTEHLLVAESLNGLATLYEKQGNSAQAELPARRALHTREQQLGEAHPLVAESLNDLAVLYGSMQGKQAQVEPLYLRALHIWEQQLGP